MLDITGYYDMHMHSSPAPFQRIADSAQIAVWCAEVGMGGLVIKSHFESTVSKVYHARLAVLERYPEFQLFAGIALNRGVGGVNPGAVEIALEQKAKVVWLPTFDAANHVQVFGAGGTYGFPATTLSSKRKRQNEPYRVTGSNGKLTSEAVEIVDMIAAYDAVLATGHIPREEIFATVDYALSVGANKLVVTHPEFVVPHLDINSMVELARLGVYMEFCAINCFPVFQCVSLAQLAEMIDAVTPDQAVLASDAGQPFNPRPPEPLRVISQSLFEKGVEETAIRKMTIDNPKKLLGVPAS